MAEAGAPHTLQPDRKIGPRTKPGGQNAELRHDHPVGLAEWGAGLAADHAAVGYARTLKEVSRDPMKCLYGISNPKEVLKNFRRW